MLDSRSVEVSPIFMTQKVKFPTNQDQNQSDLHTKFANLGQGNI
jgi:hypothetical protein